jgi:hypothetical protein
VAWTPAAVLAGQDHLTERPSPQQATARRDTCPRVSLGGRQVTSVDPALRGQFTTSRLHRPFEQRGAPNLPPTTATSSGQLNPRH